MLNVLAIGFGGMAGTLARYYLQNWAHSLFPNALVAMGTLTVNLLGCFVIGFAAHLMQAKGLAGTAIWLFVITGMMGGLTTFSTFGLETHQFFKSGMTLNGVLNILAQVGVGLLMVWSGDKISRFFW